MQQPLLANRLNFPVENGKKKWASTFAKELSIGPGHPNPTPHNGLFTLTASAQARANSHRAVWICCSGLEPRLVIAEHVIYLDVPTPTSSFTSKCTGSGSSYR